MLSRVSSTKIGALQGIKGKLFLAFGAVAALTLVVGIVGWWSLATVGSQLVGVTQRNVPHVVAALDLAKNSAATAAAAPTLFAATTDAERQQRVAAIAPLLKATSEGLAAIERYDSSQARNLRPLVDRTGTQLQALDKVVVSRLAITDRRNQLSDALTKQENAALAIVQPALTRAKNTVAAASMSIGGDANQLTRQLLKLVGSQIPAQQRLSDLVSDVGEAESLMRNSLRALD